MIKTAWITVDEHGENVLRSRLLRLSDCIMFTCLCIWHGCWWVPDKPFYTQNNNQKKAVLLHHRHLRQASKQRYQQTWSTFVGRWWFCGNQSVKSHYPISIPTKTLNAPSPSIELWVAYTGSPSSSCCSSTTVQRNNMNNAMYGHLSKGNSSIYQNTTSSLHTIY